MYTVSVQGVPRNMTVAKQLEGRLIYVKLFAAYVFQPAFTCTILKTIYHKILLVPKCGLTFLCCQYYRRYLEIQVSIF